ncbi:MAG: hypothetical protein ACXIU2_19870, partial [Cyclobacteriaceae bacterium]
QSIAKNLEVEATLAVEFMVLTGLAFGVNMRLILSHRSDLILFRDAIIRQTVLQDGTKEVFG